MKTEEETREQLIEQIADMLRNEPFTFEFKVCKKPKGIKIIYEVTQEGMDCIMTNAKNYDR
jgi:hypothetical protein